MLKILITGGAGFIGSNLVRYLVRRGHQVLNVDRLTYAGNLRSLVDIENEPNYRFAKVDIVDAESIRQALVAFAPDAVMHLAAESHVDRSIDGPRPFVETNVCGTMNLLQAALAHWRTLDGPLAERFRPRGSVHRTVTLRPAFALFGQQGGVRPLGPRLERDLRFARRRDPLFEQLRAIPIP
jgi:dTDP-glucose 4,6-dehydratase